MAIVTIDEKDYEVIEVYQDLYGMEKGNSKRRSKEILESIKEAERSFNNCRMLIRDVGETIIDWGCNIGYFPLAISSEFVSERSLGIIGIDSDKRNIDAANALAKHHNKEKAIGFVHGNVPKDVPNNMEHHLLLSVLHHINKSTDISKEIIDKLQNAKTIYMETAHHCEYPNWSSNLIPKEKSNEHPFLFWLDNLKNQFPNHVVRLINVHSTHLNSIRPLFQLKKKIHEEFVDGSDKYIIFDRFNSQSMNSPDNTRSYAYAHNRNGAIFFLKFRNEKLFRKSKYIDGLLFSDIFKMGLLPWYDRIKLRTQLTDIIKKDHQDKHLWNMIVDRESNIHLIDNDDKSMYSKKAVNDQLEVILRMI